MWGTPHSIGLFDFPEMPFYDGGSRFRASRLAAVRSERIDTDALARPVLPGSAGWVSAREESAFISRGLGQPLLENGRVIAKSQCGRSPRFAEENVVDSARRAPRALVVSLSDG